MTDHCAIVARKPVDCAGVHPSDPMPKLLTDATVVEAGGTFAAADVVGAR